MRFKNTVTMLNRTEQNKQFKLFQNLFRKNKNQSIKTFIKFLSISFGYFLNLYSLSNSDIRLVINKNLLKGVHIMNFKKLFLITFCLTFILFLVSCQTIATADNIPQSLQLSGNDITVGEVLTAELKYDAKDNTLKERLIAEALKGTTYDFLIMPRYEIFKSGLITKMRVRGKGARVK